MKITDAQVKDVQAAHQGDQQGYLAWETRQVLMGRLDKLITERHIEAWLAANRKVTVTSPLEGAQ